MKLAGDQQGYSAQKQISGRACEHVVEHYAKTASDLFVGEAYRPGFKPVETAKKAEGEGQSEKITRQPGGGYPVPHGLVYYDSLIVMLSGIRAEFMGGHRSNGDSGREENRVTAMPGRQQWQEDKSDHGSDSAAAPAAFPSGKAGREIAESGACGYKSGDYRRKGPCHSSNFNRFSAGA
jgi:hypothetical protein